MLRRNKPGKQPVDKKRGFTLNRKSWWWFVILGILAAVVVPRVMDRPDQARYHQGNKRNIACALEKRA